MATQDHGLEVIRKSSEKFNGQNHESIIRFLLAKDDTRNPFLPPPNADYMSRSVAGNVETYVYRQGGSGGTVLKTIVITYTNSSLNDILNVQVS